MPELLTRVEVWIVFVYMLAMLVVAWWVSGSANSVEGYTVGNRRMAGWAVGLSVLGTFTSSISFLGIPAKAYKENWNVYVFSLSLPIAAWIATAYFIPFYRRGDRLSVYELLEDRFGYWARLYADLSYGVLQLIRVAMVLLLVAFAVSPLLDWPIVPTVIGLGLLVIIYDTMGGIQAVIWTDVLQVMILVGGALWCLGELYFGWSGGPSALWEAIPANKTALGAWPDNLWISRDLALSTFAVVMVYGITENLRNYGTDQNYVQRMLCAASNRQAAGSIWLGAIAYLPISLIFCLIGSGLYMRHAQGMVPADIAADQVFPYFIKNELPHPIAGLVIAAILAAAMSTVDSSLNSTSTVVLVDVVRRFRRGEPRVPEIVTLRLSTVTLGVIGTGLAVVIYRLYREQSSTIMDMWWQYAGIAGGGMFGLFVLAWIAPKCPSWAAGLGVLVTIPVMVWGTLNRDLLYPSLIGVAATAALVTVGAVGLVAAAVGIGRVNPRAGRGRDDESE